MQGGANPMYNREMNNAKGVKCGRTERMTDAGAREFNKPFAPFHSPPLIELMSVVNQNSSYWHKSKKQFRATRRGRLSIGFR